MDIAEIIEVGGHQAVRLPLSIHLPGDSVEVRREGEKLVLSPIRSAGWPQDFFEKIRIDDPAFVRPPQGEMPPAPSFE